ncbi:thiol reductant ABC exporter subunit CydC [Microvirga tunisiensis]|uniref:Thiol reductant ABC exporter subunit CydC n=1 Tax=Pannonibacter tanglangensis TaxID=2750084 RepID=A0A7X5F452_9HYPH|nr:thiol reductant ABC exporter subunit CydC [Pannonibacter sp. XCT-53]NBN78415.1 thiol reductant ABC exporter subunit CydC [Pannonibacter sp. XCT-53]
MSPLRSLIRRQFADQRGPFLIGVALALVPALCGLLLLGLAGWFITACAVAGAAGLAVNYFTPSALIRALAIGRTAGRYGERLMTHDATFRFLARLRGAVFAGFASRRPASAGESRSGLRLARLTLDIDQLDRAYLRFVVPLSVVSVVLAGGAVLAVLLAPAALVPLAVGVVLLTLAARIVARRQLATAARRMEAAEEAMRLRSADFVAGRRDLAIYGGLPAATDAILDAGARRARAEDPLERAASLAEGLVTISGQLILAAGLIVLVPAAAPVAGGEASLSAALVVGLLLTGLGLTEALSSLVPGLAGLTRTERAAARVLPLAEAGDAAQAERRSAPARGPQDGPVAGTTLPPADAGTMTQPAAAGTMTPPADAGTGIQPALCFEAVRFTYPGAARPVLEDFDLSLAPGETVCLVGPSGCGKSTVLALAARLTRPDDGLIRLGDRPLSTIPEAELRRRLAVISQKPVLFNDTIAENLRLAAPQASPEALWAALDQVGLADTVAARPDGLSAMLGEGGAGLSGGEARRLTLARALLTRPEIVLLDEVTEGLDEATAAGVLASLGAFRSQGASLLLISHRRRELALADRILRLEGGRIAATA